MNNYNEIVFDAFKKRYKDYIDFDFLMNVFNNVKNESPEYKKVEYIFDIYQLDKELVRLIIGYFKFMTLTKSDDEVAKLYKNEEFISQTINDVIELFNLREFASKYFRETSLVIGDDFMFYPLSYILFAITYKALGDYAPYCKRHDEPIYIILTKALSAFSNFENCLYADIYAPMRTIFETFFKFLVIHSAGNEKLEEKMNEFKKEIFALDEDEEEIKKLYKADKILFPILAKTGSTGYKNYGWLIYAHKINEYPFTKSPFSVDGMREYFIFSQKDENARTVMEEMLDPIYKNYQYCHQYVHGNIGQTKFILQHYLDISVMLSYLYIMDWKLLFPFIEQSINGVGLFDILTKYYILNLKFSDDVRKDPSLYERHLKRIKK